MILTFPRDFRNINKEILFPEDRPVFRISPIKDGIMVFNKKGDITGQVLLNENGASMTIVDRPGYQVKALGPNNVSFELINEELKPSTVSFEFFGNYEKFQYEIFEKKPNEKKPTSLFRVVAHPLQENKANMQITGEGNILLSVMIYLTLTLL